MQKDIYIKYIQNCGDKSMQNKKRTAQIKSFLETKAKLKNYQILSMGFDASSRKYYRILENSGNTAILVDDEGCNNRRRCRRRKRGREAEKAGRVRQDHHIRKER